MKFQVNIEKAQAVLKINLEEHVVELKEATTAWIEQVKKELEALRDAVDRKGLEASHASLNKLFYGVPKDSRKDYARYIGALTTAAESGQTHVELDDEDYDRMFNDNWEWRAASKASNSLYYTKG